MHLVCLGPKNGTFTINYIIFCATNAMTVFYLYRRLKVTAECNEMFHSAAAATDTHNQSKPSANWQTSRVKNPP